MDDLSEMDTFAEDEAVFEASLIVDVEAAADAATSPPAPAGGAEAVQAGDGTSAVRQPAWLGKMLGRFKLVRLIGHGSMGFVMQAMDVNLQRIVALKVLRGRTEGLDEDNRVRQFLREAQAVAQIEHPNVIRVYEVNQHAGWWYIAMEMVEGEDLKKVVTAAGALPPARACPIVADAATALAVAHELGIVHRDVKPSNLMITRNGRCKLTDFGFVRRYGPDDPFDFTDKSVGTPQFMAPEAIRRQEQTPAMDIYSLGATLYYALTGRPPFTGQNVAEICHKHLQAPPPTFRERLPDCLPTLATLIQRSMAKDPADRPDAAALAAALRAEAISWRTDDSSLLVPSGSSIIGQVVGDHTDSGSWAPAVRGGDDRPGRRREGLSRRAKRVAWTAVAVATVVLAVAIGRQVLNRRGRKPTGLGQARATLAGRFPDAPPTYGVLPAGAEPEPLAPSAETAAFSWVGQVDTAGVKFLASKRGRHYWPIGAAAARLIRREDFVGYRTAAEATSDGKLPAPR